MINSVDFFNYIIKIFPDLKDQYNEMKQEYDDLFETLFLEDILCPKIIKLIEEDNVVLVQLFDYFEKVSNEGDEHLIEIFSITILENLGNDKNILCAVKKYMGDRTAELQKESDIDLGRNC